MRVFVNSRVEEDEETEFQTIEYDLSPNQTGEQLFWKARERVFSKTYLAKIHLKIFFFGKPGHAKYPVD